MRPPKGNKPGQRLWPDGPDSWSNPRFTISVETADEARAVVQSLKEQRADCVKVYDGLSRDSYFAIIDEAKKLGVPVVGHLPSAIGVREASQAGQRSLEHGAALAGGSTAEAAYIQRRLDPSTFQEALRTKNFTLIPAKIASAETMMLDHFSQKAAYETYSLLARNGTFITPTLVTQRALLRPRTKSPSALIGPVDSPQNHLSGNPTYREVALP